MIIINTTLVTDDSVTEEVMSWIKKSYIPSGIHCGAIADKTLLTRVLDQSQPGTTTHALHLWFDTIEQARKWDEKLGRALRSKLTERFNDKALAFHTYLEITE